MPLLDFDNNPFPELWKQLENNEQRGQSTSRVIYALFRIAVIHERDRNEKNAFSHSSAQRKFSAYALSSLNWRRVCFCVARLAFGMGKKSSTSTEKKKLASTTLCTRTGFAVISIPQILFVFTHTISLLWKCRLGDESEAASWQQHDEAARDFLFARVCSCFRNVDKANWRWKQLWSWN